MLPRSRAALERAYRDTTYRVYLPGGAAIDLLPDDRSATLDRLLARTRVREWAFLTAWNPGSRPLPGWRNAMRQRRLLDLLVRTAPVVLLAAGIPASLDWVPEDSLFAAGLPRSAALRLARRFGQNAVVAGRRGRPAELVWVR